MKKMKVWTEKYRPKSLEEMVGTRDLVTRVAAFLRSAFAEIARVRKENAEVRGYNRRIRKKNKGVPKSKRIKLKGERLPDTKKVALMLRGPPGVGKTTVVHAAARTQGSPVVETNASDERTVGRIRSLIAPTSRHSDITSFMTGGAVRPGRRKKIILIDEVDGIGGSAERGAVSEIAKIVGETAFPVIMTANEWKRSLKPLYRVCSEYEVPRPSAGDIEGLLARISRAEGVDVDRTLLREIAEGSQGDFRAAINDLQMHTVAGRDALHTLFDSLRLYFRAETPREAEEGISGSTGDVLAFFRWVEENALARAKAGKEKAICRALALADSVAGKIYSIQEWSLFPHFVEILKSAAPLLRETGDRLDSPKWFRGTGSGVESAMNRENISREEARSLLRATED